MHGIPFLRLEHVFYILHRIADCVHSAVCVPAQVAVVLHHLATYCCYGNTGYNACADSFDIIYDLQIAFHFSNNSIREFPRIIFPSLRLNIGSVCFRIFYIILRFSAIDGIMAMHKNKTEIGHIPGENYTWQH